LWLPNLVLPPSPVVLLAHYCLFGQIYHLWMTRRMVYAVLEREFLLFILDCEADLGTIRVDDGFRSA
jgi:hypothetical protein